MLVTEATSATLHGLAMQFFRLSQAILVCQAASEVAQRVHATRMLLTQRRLEACHGATQHLLRFS